MFRVCLARCLAAWRLLVESPCSPALRAAAPAKAALAQPLPTYWGGWAGTVFALISSPRCSQQELLAQGLLLDMQGLWPCPQPGFPLWS